MEFFAFALLIGMRLRGALGAPEAVDADAAVTDVDEVSPLAVAAQLNKFDYSGAHFAGFAPDAPLGNATAERAAQSAGADPANPDLLDLIAKSEAMITDLRVLRSDTQLLLQEEQNELQTKKLAGKTTINVISKDAEADLEKPEDEEDESLLIGKIKKLDFDFDVAKSSFQHELDYLKSATVQNKAAFYTARLAIEERNLERGFDRVTVLGNLRGLLDLLAAEIEQQESDIDFLLDEFVKGNAQC